MQAVEEKEIPTWRLELQKEREERRRRFQDYFPNLFSSPFHPIFLHFKIIFSVAFASGVIKREKSIGSIAFQGIIRFDSLLHIE